MRGSSGTSLLLDGVEVLEEVVRRLVGCHLACGDLRVGLVLASLPAVGPEPCLVGRNGHVRMKLDDAVVTFDDFHLSTGFIELMAPAYVHRQRQRSTALQCHVGPRHSLSSLSLELYCSKAALRNCRPHALRS